MIDYMKPVGAFLEHTIRPLIQEAKWFLDELDKRGIKVSEENITHAATHLAGIYIRVTVIRAIQNVIITLIAGAFIWKILA